MIYLVYGELLKTYFAIVAISYATLQIAYAASPEEESRLTAAGGTGRMKAQGSRHGWPERFSDEVMLAIYSMPVASLNARKDIEIPGVF